MKVYDGKLIDADFVKFYSYVNIRENPFYETDCRVIYERLAANGYKITRDGESWLEIYDSTCYRDRDNGDEPPFYGHIRRIAANTAKRTLCIRDRSLCYRPQFKDYIVWPTDQWGYRSFDVDSLYGKNPADVIGTVWDIYAIRKLGLKVCEE